MNDLPTITMPSYEELRRIEREAHRLRAEYLAAVVRRGIEALRAKLHAEDFGADPTVR